jgi:hypothetical protein
MVRDKELVEYRKLYAALKALHEKYLERRGDICQALKECGALKRKALLALVKANRLTRHLTGPLRQAVGLSYSLNEIMARIRQAGAEENSPVVTQSSEGLILALSEPADLQGGDDYRKRRELRQKGLTILAMIDDLRKKILQLDLLGLRCRELILAIDKALEAFRHESIIIRRKLYPLGIFSVCFRSLRALAGSGYFSFRDIKELTALGNITGSVLKIADSPVI